MAREQMSKEEAIMLLTKQRDLLEDATTKAEAIQILAETGKAIGYTPAFRCLVNGLEPEDSIRWER